MPIAATRKTQPAAAPLFHGQSAAHAPDIDDDFVTNMVLRARRICPQMTDEQARQLDRETREEDGGCTPYIAKRQGEGRSDRNAAIRRDYRRGESIPLLMRRYQLSRVTIWRVLELGPAGE